MLFVCLFVSFIFVEFLFDGRYSVACPFVHGSLYTAPPLYLSSPVCIENDRSDLSWSFAATDEEKREREREPAKPSDVVWLSSSIFWCVPCSFVVVVSVIVELCPNGGFASPSCTVLCCIILGNKADAIFILLAIYPIFRQATIILTVADCIWSKLQKANESMRSIRQLKNGKKWC